MDYKKKYMEALERAKKMLASKRSVIVEKQALETIFPELAEVEDKIMKRCIGDVVRKYGSEFTSGTVTKEKMLAWLERQGKQKEINLVEILKHYPRETELYSPLYGKLWLAEVDEEHEIITCYKYRLDEGCTRATLEQENTVSFYSNGTTGLPDYTISKDCMLFLYNIEKQSEQKNPCEDCSSPKLNCSNFPCIERRAFDSGKSVFECIKTEHEQVESKFKVGDWLQYRSAEPFLVEEITEQGYINGNSCLPFEWENEIHLWTIKDAKDGDVLAVDSRPFIYNGSKNSVTAGAYCGFNEENMFSCAYNYVINRNIVPATKEQQDYLFQKMGESGYIWDEQAKMLICSTNMKSK